MAYVIKLDIPGLTATPTAHCCIQYRPDEPIGRVALKYDHLLDTICRKYRTGLCGGDDFRQV